MADSVGIVVPDGNCVRTSFIDWKTFIDNK